LLLPFDDVVLREPREAIRSIGRRRRHKLKMKRTRVGGEDAGRRV